MKRLEYKVELACPAFLGAADQSGEWRAPPFKALLRQWWRVVVAREYAYDVEKIREREGVLFGHAWLKHKQKTWSARGQISVAIRNWVPGTMEKWDIDPTVPHPYANTRVGTALYLGYGPLLAGPTKLKKPPAIGAEETAQLLISMRRSDPSIEKALRLMHLFGTIGGRSRNGWGSFSLANESAAWRTLIEPAEVPFINAHSLPLERCLESDWPAALGSDARGLLIWQTEPTNSWRDAMKQLAEVKLSYRALFRLRKSEFTERHLLALPITRHEVGSKSRVANQLRFKLVKLGERFVGVAYHLPCAFPEKLEQKLRSADRARALDRQLEVWAEVHKCLDKKMKPLSEARR